MILIYLMKLVDNKNSKPCLFLDRKLATYMNETRILIHLVFAFLAYAWHLLNQMQLDEKEYLVDNIKYKLDCY